MKEKLLDILLTNTLPFWSKKMSDMENGGFYGRVTGDNEVIPTADKGAILNSRILWTFSAVNRFLNYRGLVDPEFLNIATISKRYLIDHFYDKTYGGVYWSVNYKGEPVNTKKQFYALGFAIYGLSEYFRATDDTEALKYAKKLFYTIEEHSFDSKHNGYIEATTRDWKEIKDMRLSDKDVNEKKTMNTHLHILESYTNLYRIWPDERLRHQLINLVNLFPDKILDKKTNHLGLFFDEKWHRHGNEISFGHDIEASWLILEAAKVLDDKNLTSMALDCTRKIAFAALEGLQEDGSMIYELHNDGTADMERHWWVQAETLIGLIYLNKFHDYPIAGKLAEKSLQYISDNLLDYKNGEWYWSIKADGSVNTVDDKAGFWKCPYHNSRMCIEALEQLIESAHS
ncbi:MAG: AGE family epimerase/isomerase [Rikenellaceae bacterium]